MGGLMTSALGHVNTAPARAAFHERFVDQVDPERALGSAERARRAEAARRLYFTRLALRSSVVRGKRKPAPVIVSPGAGQEGSGGSRRDPSAA
jgi:hypothetical protein